MIITKHCNNHLLAHIYEHVYFIHLDTLFREKGFFPIIDYSIDAFTEDGIITFDIESYRNIDILEAIDSANLLAIENREYIHIALNQIECEYGEEILFDNVDSLSRKLSRLNSTAWNSDLVVKLAYPALMIGESIETKHLRVLFGYSGISTKVKPLYRLIAGVTVNTLISDIVDTYGGFVSSEAFATDGSKNIVGEIILKTAVSTKEIDKLYAETKRELLDSGGYSRLLEDLRSVNSMAYPPSIERTLADTGVIMNDKKWAEVSKEDNLKNILPLLEPSIHYVLGYTS